MLIAGLLVLMVKLPSLFAASRQGRSTCLLCRFSLLSYARYYIDGVMIHPSLAGLMSDWSNVASAPADFLPGY